MNNVITTYNRSPINYMGGKYRSLKYVTPRFKDNIDTFYDVFSGSGTVHLNTSANNVVASDINSVLIDLQEYISMSDPYVLYEDIKRLADHYNLASECSEGYIALRKEYNNDRSLLKLLALSQHSFNYLIRFNMKGGFNASHGKGICKLSEDYLSKLVAFREQTKSKNALFKSGDFRQVIDVGKLKRDDLVYCDPPYLLSEAVYNEKRAFGGWSVKDSLELLDLLNVINTKGVNFALSEMISSKGEINTLLANWVEDNGYYISYHDVKYLGVPSAHINDKKSVEVLVTNYY